MAKDLRLNSAFVKTRLTELGLKQWWLADKIGVDRKTVTRWLGGQVKSLQMDNATALARALDCQVDDLVLRDEGEHLASAEDQKAAAKLLVTSSLMDKLGPIGEWDVIESLLKATIVPHLPLRVLGEMYNQLCVASWRQSKIDQAALYNTKAQEIARQCGEDRLLAAALLSTANIHSWRGQTAAACKAYESCLRLCGEGDERLRAGAHSNLGAVLLEAGDLDGAETQIRQALALYTSHGTAMNRSIALTHLANIQLQRLELDQSQASAEQSLAEARAGDYKRGLEMNPLILAEIAARRGRADEARTQMEKALSGFTALGIEEGLNYEFPGRICRLLNNLKASEIYLQQGLKLAATFPVYRAAIHLELALTLKDPNHARVAERLYLEAGCPLRAAKCRHVP